MTVALLAAAVIISDDDGHRRSKNQKYKKGRQQCTQFNARIWFYISKLISSEVLSLLLSSFDRQDFLSLRHQQEDDGGGVSKKSLSV